MAGGIAFTKNYTATPTSTMILGKDGNRKELTIFNKSNDVYVFIGFGIENQVFTPDNTLPLAPGEAYDAIAPPLSAVYILTEEYDVPCVVYYSTTSNALVSGVLGGKTN